MDFVLIFFLKLKINVRVLFRIIQREKHICKIQIYKKYLVLVRIYMYLNLFFAQTFEDAMHQLRISTTIYVNQELQSYTVYTF